MTAAILRNTDPTAAGNGPTTSSLRDLLRVLLRTMFLLQSRPRPRRQAQNADKALRVLLVIAGAHRERGQVGAVEREFRLAPCDRNIALIELERHRAADFLLRLSDK